MSVRYTRRFKLGDRGSDVEGVGRALCRSGCGIPLLVFAVLPQRVRRTWGPRKQLWLKRFKKRHGLPADALYGSKAHAKLSRYFDAYAASLMKKWEEPVARVEPRQGYNSLTKSLWESYSIGRNMGLADVGTYNPASRLPSGRPSDHACYPAHAFDLGFSPATGYAHPAASKFFWLVTERPEIEYVILGNRIWSRGYGLHSYNYGGHESHVHVSGRHSYLQRIKDKLP